jgi:hypothetical protein
MLPPTLAQAAVADKIPDRNKAAHPAVQIIFFNRVLSMEPDRDKDEISAEKFRSDRLSTASCILLPIPIASQSAHLVLGAPKSAAIHFVD